MDCESIQMAISDENNLTVSFTWICSENYVLRRSFFYAYIHMCVRTCL